VHFVGFGGKVALVTGAGPGLGTTLSRMLADDGATVVAVARTAREIPGATVIAGDVTSVADMRELAETMLATHGRVDVLVNAAFPGTHRMNVLDMDDDYLDLWRRATETATYGTLLACRFIAPIMVARGAGSIVNVTSMSSRQGYAGRSDFAAGKAGVHLLTHCLADEIGPAGVRVNCVAPGWIASSVLDDWMAKRAADEGVTFEEIRARDVEAMALRRIATEEDVARAVMFLASDASQAITGATLDVNGGQLFT
jgi:NAD(P)-dependent dehydrogenase (short-subunit alcohol dehydrogenase family)